MQHLMQGHNVDAAIGQVERIHVALADLGIPYMGAGQVGAGQGQHLDRLVNAQAAFDMG